MEQSFELEVSEIRRETADAVSISFAVPDELASAFDYRAGQFLTVGVPSDETGLVARCYSLCSSPALDEPMTITVKRTPGGFASHWLVEQLREGDRLRVLPPSGIFTPASYDDDLLLFAGGSGITPVMSILTTQLTIGSGRAVLFYANTDSASVIFGSKLDALAEQHADRLELVHWLEAERGLPSAETLTEFASRYAEWNAFTCGPAPFMAAVNEALRGLGFPRARRHQEKFVSLGGNPFEV